MRDSRPRVRMYVPKGATQTSRRPPAMGTRRRSNRPRGSAPSPRPPRAASCAAGILMSTAVLVALALPLAVALVVAILGRWLARFRGGSDRLGGGGGGGRRGLPGPAAPA